MRIYDIKAGQRNIDVEGVILGKPDVRTVNKKDGGTARTAEVGLSDASGQVKLVLWDSEINAVSVGDKVKIENGYSTGYKGVTQLAVGKFGKLSKIADDSKPAGPNPYITTEGRLQILEAAVAKLEKTVYG